MQPRYKQLPHVVKLRRLYANQFYLPPVHHRELLSMCEMGMIVHDREAVDYVDEYGEWLDG